MTELLQKAISEASKLPDDEQDRLGEWLLAELKADRAWDDAFRQTADELVAMARRALDEHHRGLTKELDPDEL
jgi:hypothetical protein